MTTEPGNIERMYWKDMSEGQQKLYELCAKVTAIHERIIENNHPLAKSPLSEKLIKSANNLFLRLEETGASFDSDGDTALKLIKKGAKIQNDLWHFLALADLPDSQERERVDIGQDFDSVYLSQKMEAFTSEGISKKISVVQTNLERGDHSGYGDYIVVSAERDIEEGLEVEYDEMFEWGVFEKSVVKKIDLLDIAKLFDPNAKKEDIVAVEADTKNRYFTKKGRGPNFEFSERFHDYGGIHTTITVKCKNPEQAGTAIKFFLEAVKNNPRVGKIKKAT